jgi:hypothetical protein
MSSGFKIGLFWVVELPNLQGIEGKFTCLGAFSKSGDFFEAGYSSV